MSTRNSWGRMMMDRPMGMGGRRMEEGWRKDWMMMMMMMMGGGGRAGAGGDGDGD